MPLDGNRDVLATPAPDPWAVSAAGGPWSWLRSGRALITGILGWCWGILRAGANGVVLLLSPAIAPLRVLRRHISVAIGRGWKRIEPWVHRQPLWRLCTRTIGHRIFAANLVGFLILFIGLIFVSQANRWLVDAKVESLTAQARLIAAAIAANAKIDTGQVLFDPDGLIMADPPPGTVLDDAFVDVRLPIAPERVAPILAKLVPSSDVRVRIYGPDGGQVIDTAQRLRPGQISRATAGAPKAASPPDEDLSNLWTWFLSLFIRSDMAVYREVLGDRAAYPEIESALRGETTRMLLVSRKVEQIVAVAAPVQSINGVRGAVFLTSRPGDIDNLLDRQRRALLVLTGIALLTALFASWLLRRTIAGPMHRLSAAAEHVTRSINAKSELPEFPNRRDEIGTLANSFREMTASLYRRLERSDRYAMDVAHELKNPVAAAQGLIGTIQYAKTDAQRAEMLDRINQELTRLNRLITEIMKAQRLESELALQRTEPVDMATLTRDLGRSLDEVHRDSKHPVRVAVEVEHTSRPGMPFVVEGNDIRLGQVLTNLISNAASFSPTGGEVKVTLKREGGNVIITVDDAGPGIPEDALEKVFKRFYSDRPQSDQIKGKNSGLGLSISREIIAVHKGEIYAENRRAEPGVPVGIGELPELAARRIPGVAGARFTVVLPAHDAKPQPR